MSSIKLINQQDNVTGVNVYVIFNYSGNVASFLQL
jgi:hypothetical protein